MQRLILQTHEIYTTVRLKAAKADKNTNLGIFIMSVFAKTILMGAQTLCFETKIKTNVYIYI